MHTTPDMPDLKCDGKTHRLVGKKLSQRHIVTTPEHKLHSNKGRVLIRLDKFKTKAGMWKANATWDTSNHTKPD